MFNDGSYVLLLLLNFISHSPNKSTSSLMFLSISLARVVFLYLSCPSTGCIDFFHAFTVSSLCCSLSQFTSLKMNIKIKEQTPDLTFKERIKLINIINDYRGASEVPNFFSFPFATLSPCSVLFPPLGLLHADPLRLGALLPRSMPAAHVPRWQPACPGWLVYLS